MLSHPFALIALIALLAAMLRLLTYRKCPLARRRLCISWLAWLLLVVMAGQAIELTFKPAAVTIFDAGLSVLISLFVFRTRGNVASLLKE